mgnify:CR=1 FL=1
MQFLHLDTYYFYAPIPRVLKLKEKLEGNVVGYRILYIPFSSPRYFLKMLIRAVTGVEITSITRLRNIEFRRSALQRVIEILKPIFSGRKHSVCIDLEKVVKYVDEESLAMIDFLVFLLRYGDRASEILNRGICSEGAELCINRDEAEELRRLTTRIESLASLTRRHTSLFDVYEKYMVCRTCRLLGIRYPGDILILSKPSIVEDKEIQKLLATCSQCSYACTHGSHIDDIVRALAIQYYAERNPGTRILIATVRSITKKRVRECFSCLAECLETISRNIEVVKKT